MISIGALMLSVVAIIVILGITSMSNIGNKLEIISRQDIPLLNTVTSVTTLQLEQFVWMERAFLASELGNKKDMTGAIKSFEKLTESIELRLGEILKLINTSMAQSDKRMTDEQVQGLLNKTTRIKQDYSAFSEDVSELFGLMKSGRIRVSQVSVTAIENALETMTASLQSINAEVASNVESTAIAARDNENAATKSLIIFSLAALLLALFFGYVILRSIGQQLGSDPSELVDITSALSAGDLQIDRDTSAVGVYGALNIMVDKLIQIIGGIKSGAHEVAIAASQVSQGNTNLSQRTQEQASSLEEIASSMEEMTSTVKQNAENASHANKLAQEAREQADAGGGVVSKAIEAMSEISTSSKKIAEITSVINDIAFQTNLLALNAAVEAARAGEQGRGFAVVASEVRSLAGRSAVAAKEIKVLIDESLEKVADGTKLVNASGGALGVIVTSVKKVSDIVAEIAAASKEQSVGIVQMNRALMQMDEMTQQNASLVEEASAASESMGTQAHDLTKLVEFFMINDVVEEYSGHIGRIHYSQTNTKDSSLDPYSEKTKSLTQSKQVEAKEEDDDWQNF